MNCKYLLSLLILGGLMTACGDDEPDSKLEQNEQYTTMSIYADEEGSTGASVSKYNMTYNLLAGDVTIQCASLSIGHSNVSFETASVPFSTAVIQDSYVVNTIHVSSHVPMTSAGVKIDNLSMYLTNGIYDLKRPAPGVSNEYSFSVGLFMQYTLNNTYKVKSMPVDVCYGGSTVTSFPDSNTDGMSAYQSDDMMYRIVFNTSRKTADVVLYDAKFAPAAPALKGIVLRDLAVEFTSDAGFVVSGTDIVPETFEGTDASTPNPRYSFNSFSIASSNSDLTKVRCEYTVATVFKGSFEGSAVRPSK